MRWLEQIVVAARSSSSGFVIPHLPRTSESVGATTLLSGLAPASTQRELWTLRDVVKLPMVTKVSEREQLMRRDEADEVLQSDVSVSGRWVEMSHRAITEEELDHDDAALLEELW